MLKPYRELISILSVCRLQNNCVTTEWISWENAAYQSSGGHYSSNAPSQRAIRCLGTWLGIPELRTDTLPFEPVLSYACLMMIEENVSFKLSISNISSYTWWHPLYANFRGPECCSRTRCWNLFICCVRFRRNHSRWISAHWVGEVDAKRHLQHGQRLPLECCSRGHGQVS